MIRPGLFRSCAMLALLLLAPACAADIGSGDPDLDDAELATASDGLGSNAARLAGLYTMIGGGRRTGDVDWLDLTAAGHYERGICSAGTCSPYTLRDGRFDLTHANGKNWLVLYRSGSVLRRYEYLIRLAPRRVLLRAEGTTRWMVLLWSPPESDEARCTATHGAWLDDDPGEDGLYCACTDPAQWIPNRGGCVGFSVSVSACVESGGTWRADDSCGCPRGTTYFYRSGTCVLNSTLCGMSMGTWRLADATHATQWCACGSLRAWTPGQGGCIL